MFTTEAQFCRTAKLDVPKRTPEGHGTGSAHVTRRKADAISVSRQGREAKNDFLSLHNLCVSSEQNERGVKKDFAPRSAWKNTPKQVTLRLLI